MGGISSRHCFNILFKLMAACISIKLLQTIQSELFEPRSEKTGLRGFQPGPTQTGLYSHRRWLEAGNFVYRKKRDGTIYVAKTKALLSCAVSTQLICVFVFAYAKVRLRLVGSYSKKGHQTIV